MRVLMTCVLVLILSATISAEAQILRFEAEDIVVTEGAWQENKFSDNLWNLWSTDKDAMKKWSEGIVLQSPRVMQDREKPEDGAPVLHAVVTDLPPGRYDVTLARVGRPIGVSFDGETWRRQTNGFLGIFEITDGRFEVWVDDRYAAVTGAGSCYFDYLEFNRLVPRKRPKVDGWATERVTERLDRGVIALPMPGNRIYVGWRLLADDPGDVGFNIYRSNAGGAFAKLNDRPLTDTCDFVDDHPAPGVENTYAVRAVVAGTGAEPALSAPVIPSEEGRPYISIPLQGDYTFQKVGIADLNGDGRYDFIIKQPNANVDPYIKYWKPSPGTYKIEAYLSDGTFLWRRDLGWSIEQGIWYSPMVVYDLDGDGRAEVCLKTGPAEDLRDEDGRVRTGPEFLSVWDGMTGEEIARVDWPSREGFENYNVASRNQLCVAYLDGKTPCLIAERGTYSTMKVAAYQLRDGKLELLWQWNDRDDGGKYRGQGAHSMHAADIDGDGRDEVFLGSSVLDDNGVGLWSTGRGHCDHHYVGDIDPTRPGLEVYYGYETHQTEGGCLMVDARTGEELWKLDQPTRHVHSSGMCADIDASHPGMECYSGEKDFPDKKWLWAASGELIAMTDLGGLAPRNCYWDADLQRELIRGSRIYDFRGATHLDDLQGRLIAVCDLIGDWREELITTVPGEIRIYSTTIPAGDRRVCLMQDPIYRMDVVIQAMGYTQMPMTTHCLSAGEAALTVGVAQPRIEPGKATTLEVSLIAPVDAALKGVINLIADTGLKLDTTRIEADVPAGRVRSYQVGLTLTEHPGLLEDDVTRTVSAVFEGARRLEAEAEVTALDLPATDLPRVQAEDFSAQGGGEVHVRNDKVGDDGRSISHWDNEGHWLEWTLIAPTEGDYYVVLRYCSMFANLRRAAIDGEVIGAGDFRFADTGGFSSSAGDWRHATLLTGDEPTPVHLSAGEHTLRLTNADGKGMNLDYIALVPASAK
ncbi:MAG: hypothetical protein J7M38_10750 [Armatimonadetes bacterium]|nr:hypothetical protein [Armatimonadota bacterium]